MLFITWILLKGFFTVLIPKQAEQLDKAFRKKGLWSYKKIIPVWCFN